jgi:hypothetical protein
MNYFKVLSLPYLTEGTEERQKCYQDSRSPGWDSKPEPSEYKVGEISSPSPKTINYIIKNSEIGETQENAQGIVYNHIPTVPGDIRSNGLATTVRSEQRGYVPVVKSSLILSYWVD